MSWNGMYAMVDYRAVEVIQNLTQLGFTVVRFSAKGLVYPAIDGHPDIFIFSDGKHWVLAPNTPHEIVQFFEQNNVHFQMGYEPVGRTYPDTVRYNVYVDDEVCIMHPYADRIFDEIINHQQLIRVSQGYVRCNVFRIGNEFVTSDVQIHNSLLKHGLVSHYVLPEKIRLWGVRHGFIGGCFGVCENYVFFTGNHSFVYQPLLAGLCRKFNYEMIPVGSGYPVDIGGVFFI